VYEFRILTRRGNIRWLRNHSRPMWDKALGRVSRIYGGMQDMTEWKQAMEAMQESEQIFHRFVAVEQDGLLLLNDHGYVVEWNAAAERILSQSKMDVLGMPLWDVMFERAVGEHKNDAGYEHLKAMTQDWMQNKQTIQDENWVQLEIEHPDGTHQMVQMLLFPIQTSKGKLFGGIVKTT
jgi:PAS domain S-box-containing protein